MGMHCYSTGRNTDSKYYFNDIEEELTNGIQVDSSPININNASMEQRVSITISLKNVDMSTEHKVELVCYSDNERKLSNSAGFTEKKSKNISDNSINFEQFFIIPYFFEKQQLLDFKIYYNQNDFETVQTSLGTIMGKRGQTLKKKLNNGEDIYISGKEMKRSNKTINLQVNIQGNNNVKMGLRYSFSNLGTAMNPVNLKLYDSESKSINKSQNNNTNDTVFSLCKIPMNVFNSNGNANDTQILIEISDVIHSKKLGEFKGPISSLLSPQVQEIFLQQNLKASLKCTIENHPTFISYLRSGININLTIGIDFTGSNGHYKDEISYHYLYAGMNNYEKAIRSCGDIVAPYDSDQLFPVFGFGFCFIDKPGTDAEFNYPINCNENSPEIHTIDGVLKEYRNFITKINLSGPTYFSPMINDLNTEVKKELNEGKIMNYHILMILTDGIIDDMDETKDALVEASFLPISVIIIGIGDADFGKMNVLDADTNPLYDRNKRKADRDLVQFVPFDQFKDNPHKLAEKVLEEIPRQVIEYYQHNNIDPKDEEFEE